MITYSAKKETINMRVGEMTLFQLKPCIIIAPILLLLGIFSLVTGYMFIDKEMLIIGYSSLFGFIFLCFLWLRIYTSLKKQLINKFDEFGINETIDYAIEKEGGRFEIICLNNSKTIVFANSDISKISFKNNLIIIKLKTNVIIDFPNTEEIRCLFV